ncbi:sodium:proton antiporter [Cellulomonas sp. URHD0024]|uniref:cation:proton antiporter n=1 Tax=Cellulomonas sp. URHD0024 TaxID=1302620 RepID=UPI000410AAB7|nr:cation:proton antiporter [Cellulomonas sp. URHD0024]
MEGAPVLVVAVIGIVAATRLAPKVGIAGPLLLVVLGVLASFVPGAPTLHVEPELILAGVLPPLLYSSAVSMPGMDFRRDFGAIGGLSVVLVVLSAVVLGWFFAWALDIRVAWGIALGAVVSPTDAVATSITKRLGVSSRLVTVLEGESLLNDASALVLLRSAIAATAVTVSLWSVLGQFVYAVVVAAVIGAVVGVLNLRVRSALPDAAASTAVSFVAPFVAFLPAERLQASGLVAAVVAGLVTGQGAPRFLRPQDRLAEESNWRTIELLLEGAVFLVMGYELQQLVAAARDDDGTALPAVGLGIAAIALTLAVRALYVSPLVWWLSKQAAASDRMKARYAQVTQTLADDESEGPRIERRRARWTQRVTRGLADIDYLVAKPLGAREGTVLVWAGMRGAVTLAAAQTLPEDTPRRSLLILIAFVVAAGSLLLQGGTLPWVVRTLGVGSSGASDDDPERAELLQTLSQAAVGLLDDPTLVRRDGSRYDQRLLDGMKSVSLRRAADFAADEPRSITDQLLELQLAVIDAQREALLQARSDGTFSSAALSSALAILDADQISAELKGGPTTTSED